MCETGRMWEKFMQWLRGPVCATCGRRHHVDYEHCEWCGKASPYAATEVFCFEHINEGVYGA